MAIWRGSLEKVEELRKTLGFHLGFTDEAPEERGRRVRLIRRKLAASGLPFPPAVDDDEEGELLGMFAGFHQRLQLAEETRCPVDARIEEFLSRHCADVQLDCPLRLPGRTFVLDRLGLARELSLPVNGDRYDNAYVSSYRVKNGVLHNPRADRRTTAGTFHVAEGGLPVPADKKAVPKYTFAKLFEMAFESPPELLGLPFTAELPNPARTFVSLLLRPLVCPEVPGYCDEKRMETRFFVPGGLVSNLDFVESIFGNGGDPFLPDNDAGLDVRHWTGHTGCVILAPHLCGLRKRDVGLPHVSQATERRRRDGMCWESDHELYNDGQPFKLTCRTDAGVIITLIADNYFGYCKKEVKTQLSYVANLYGNVEEEHAGGTLAFSSYNLGEEFIADAQTEPRRPDRTFADVARDYAAFIDVRPEGYGIDRHFRDLVYIPETARVTIHDQTFTWRHDGVEQSLPLLPGKVYMTPSGYKVRLEKHPEAPSWRLVGTAAEGIFCHRPCTVSGGGKSEISKSLDNYMLYGPIFVADLRQDIDRLQEIFDRDYSTRWRPDSPNRPDYSQRASRKLLDPSRSLGSVIKLLAPSADYTDEFNAWLAAIPSYIYALVFIIKRFQKREWQGQAWRDDFSVDIVNGEPGHELKYKNRKLLGDYLRVGFDRGHNWRTYKLRQDFLAAAKVQTEDDISASVVVPTRFLNDLGPQPAADAHKFAANCEYRLFQRPDDVIHRGLDRQAEADLAKRNNFISNFEPLSHEQISKMANYVIDLHKFTEPMQKLLREVAVAGRGYAVCSSMPRVVNGQPSKNPRYLQDRPDLVTPRDRYVVEVGVRLARGVPANKPVHLPVNTVLVGRRNNPPGSGLRGLAIYNPLHYQELPELFMDFICSLTGKSPSTTGAGSEGAMTKAAFNAVLPITDLNTALVSYLLTGLGGFSSAAGHIGPHIQVDHDISLLMPEMWCRLSPDERDPINLIEQGLLEPLYDYDFQGERILASRLGYRMTGRFVQRYFGRVFDNPAKVFDEAILKPETQDPAAFADGVKYLCEAHERVSQQYFEDGSIAQACPPLRALLHIMARGSYEGKDLHHADIRCLFTRQYLLQSDWYRDRLRTKQRRDIDLWRRHIQSLTRFLKFPASADAAARLALADRKHYAEEQLRYVSSAGYLDDLYGTLGADPM